MNNTNTTTFDEIAQARPFRGAGAPARSRSHYDAILELLRRRGPKGVLSSELYAQPHLYGRSPRNRISELRKAGHLIEGKPHGSSDWFYRLIRDDAGLKPSLKNQGDGSCGSNGQNEESEFMRRRHEEQAAAMPLFVELRP